MTKFNQIVASVAYVTASAVMLASAALFLFPITISIVCLTPWIYSEEIKQYLRPYYMPIVNRIRYKVNK